AAETCMILRLSLMKALVRVLPVVMAAALAAVAVASCSGSSGGSTPTLNVVAAENFWGSIAQQIAGNKASVRSIIVNPATDPHAYEPTAQDGRTLATAQLVIVNGIGYDPW